MTFLEAVQAMKSGGFVRRSSWDICYTIFLCPDGTIRGCDREQPYETCVGLAMFTIQDVEAVDWVIWTQN